MESSEFLMERWETRTVNGDGDRLCQLIAISAYKGWNSPELVELQIFGAERSLGNICVDNLKVKLVGLGYGSYGCGAWVKLPKAVSIFEVEKSCSEL